MDNKRVFRTQKRNTNSTPYQRPGSSDGLFSKVKGFFNQSSFWSRNKSTSSDNYSTSEREGPLFSEKAKSTPVLDKVATPFKFPAPDSSLLLNSKLKDASLDSLQLYQIQNKTLADFFTKKGNEPLSEIEQEGVVSIIRRSNPNTPSKQSQDTTIFTTPPSQRIFKPSEEVPHINTPEFVPIYSQSSSPAPTASVRRIYQFSGLPSPYRTRIKPPVTKTPFHSPQRMISPVATQPKVEDMAGKPLSDTASTLLSLLDNAGDSKTANSEGFEDYANPYAASPSHHKRKPEEQLNNGAIKKASVSDIEKSISHDRTQQLTSNHKYKPIKSSSLREAIVPDSHEGPSNTASSKTVEGGDKMAVPSLNKAKPQVGTYALFSNGSMNGAGLFSSKPQEEKLQRIPIKVDSPAENGVIKSSQSSPNPFGQDFTFPSVEVPIESAKFDDSRVQKYRDTFVF